jgi:hypothetical protein
MSLDEIILKLTSIKKKGYVKSLRKGSTGIGKTLETLLGIVENNIPLPDFGEIELKATRENSQSMITLFTFNNKVWRVNQLKAVEKYGSEDKNGRLGLYYTMSVIPNSSGLFLFVDDDNVEVRHVDGTVVVSWQLRFIEAKFEEKVKSVLLVKAKSEMRGDDEYFYYDKAKLLTGGTTKEILKTKFENGQLLIDLRLHDNNKTARNHGTGFRVYERDLEDLYEKVERINF